MNNSLLFLGEMAFSFHNSSLIVFSPQTLVLHRGRGESSGKGVVDIPRREVGHHAREQWELEESSNSDGFIPGLTLPSLSASRPYVCSSGLSDGRVLSSIPEASVGCDPNDRVSSREGHVDCQAAERPDRGEGGAHQVSKLLGAYNHIGGNRIGSGHQFGSTLSDIFDRSWRRAPRLSWRWIPKSSSLGDLGFVARSCEVRRFGSQARVVRCVREPEPLLRSFTEDVREGAMDRGRGQFPHRFGGGAHFGVKQSAPDDWMEEDDLLSENELREKAKRDQD